MAQKTKRKQLEGKLDNLWRKVGKQSKCAVCQTLSPSERVGYGHTQMHHIIVRSRRILRWDLRNRVELCFTHHTGGPFSAHNNPIWFAEWLQTHRPEDYRYLKSKMYEIKKWTLSELEGFLQKYD